MARRPSVLSLVDIAGRMVLAELDLRPGNGVPGGEYLEWMAVQGNSTAFVWFRWQPDSPRKSQLGAIRGIPTRTRHGAHFLASFL